MAAKRVICLLSKDQDAQAIYQDMKSIVKSSAERLAFLKKKADQLGKEHNEKIGEQWKKLGSLLLDKGYLTSDEYVYSRDTIGIDVEGDAIWYKKDGHNESQGGNPLPRELREILEEIFS